MAQPYHLSFIFFILKNLAFLRLQFLCIARNIA